MTTSGSTRRGRPRTAGLSKQVIATKALELIEREGVAALSMRRLGAELGVDATAFYRYFPDKDALILAAGDLVTAEVLTHARQAASTATTWQDRVRSMYEGAWQASLRHPGILALTSARTTGEDAERAIIELLLETIAPLGLDERRTVLAYRMFGDCALALTGQHASLLSLGEDGRDKEATAWSRLYGGSSELDFPLTRRHIAALTAVTDREIFDFTLEVLISGIELLVAQSAASTGGESTS